MLGRSMTKIDDALPEHDASRWAIGEIGALGGDLCRKAERVRRPCASNLYPRASLPSKRLGYIIGSRRKGAELWMQLGIIVQPASKAAKLTTLDQSGKGLVNR